MGKYFEDIIEKIRSYFYSKLEVLTTVDFFPGHGYYQRLIFESINEKWFICIGIQNRNELDRWLLNDQYLIESSFGEANEIHIDRMFRLKSQIELMVHHNHHWA